MLAHSASQRFLVDLMARKKLNPPKYPMEMGKYLMGINIVHCLNNAF